MAEPPSLIAVKPLKPDFQDLATIALNSDEFTLGRSLGNSAVIAFLSLSRKHCIFRRKCDDVWTVEDMSAFGIRLNSHKLTKGTEHRLSNNDVLQLEPTGEFIYKFLLSNQNKDANDPPSKKIKLEDEDCEDILQGAKQMFEESQCFEVENLEMKIKNAQQLQTNSILLKRQMEEELEEKMGELNQRFEVQIESLKGEKQEVERQKAELERERDGKLAEMRQQMDDKITELKNQITKHNETEKVLLEENGSLKERLVQEREEFLAQLREAAGRDELLQQLQEKCRHQEEARLAEKQKLEESLRREREQLKIAQELMEARAESERKLKEAHENTEKSLETLKKQVAENELKMSILAERRVQEEAFKSKQKMSVLQEELDRVRTELECEKIVRLFASDVVGGEEGASGSGAVQGAEGADGPAAVRNQFGELLESEMQCTICADLLISAITLNCSHTFCKYCITQWKKKKRECPICRAFITSECRSLVIDSLIEKMVDNLSDDIKQKRLQILKDREELEAQTSKEGVAGTSRGRAGSDYSTTASDSEGSGGESDSSSEEGWGESEHHEDDWGPVDDYHPDPIHRFFGSFFRPEYFDYDDSGSDIDPSEDEHPPGQQPGPGSSSTTVTGADANAGGGPGGSGAVALGRGAGAAGARRGRASRNNTTSRSRSRQIIAGTPGSYYGGYGRCYHCGARGHWAPGCPFN